jgi:hypothetical protein
VARATFSAYTCVSMCGAWQVVGSSERSNNRLSKCLKLWISCGSSKPGLPISSQGRSVVWLLAIIENARKNTELYYPLPAVWSRSTVPS